MKLYREKAGVIALDPVWVCFYGEGCYWVVEESLLLCLFIVVTEWKHDRHLVG